MSSNTLTSKEKLVETGNSKNGGAKRASDRVESDRLQQVIEQLQSRYGDRLIDTLEADLLRKEITYDDYLETPALLSLQSTLTDYHDELIFKVYHQQTELWFRLILHETSRAIRELLQEPADSSRTLEAVERINRYFAVLSNSYSVMLNGLSTDEFMIFRKAFGTSSGFQSAQFRAIEILVGLERDKKPHVSSESRSIEEQKLSEQKAQEHATFYWERAARHLVTNEPTLTLTKFKEQHLKHLNELYARRTPFSLRMAFLSVIERSMETEAATFEMLYSSEKLDSLLPIAEELIKLDDAIVEWKQQHLKVAAKHLSRTTKGTGETNWADYLSRSIAEQRIFPDLRLARDAAEYAKK